MGRRVYAISRQRDAGATVSRFVGDVCFIRFSPPFWLAAHTSRRSFMPDRVDVDWRLLCFSAICLPPIASLVTMPPGRMPAVMSLLGALGAADYDTGVEIRRAESGRARSQANRRVVESRADSFSHAGLVDYSRQRCFSISSACFANSLLPMPQLSFSWRASLSYLIMPTTPRLSRDDSRDESGSPRGAALSMHANRPPLIAHSQFIDRVVSAPMRGRKSRRGDSPSRMSMFALYPARHRRADAVVYQRAIAAAATPREIDD